MALYLGKLLPQNSQKPNYETHHPPYGTFRQREATRMTLTARILSIVSRIFISPSAPCSFLHAREIPRILVTPIFAR